MEAVPRRLAELTRDVPSAELNTQSRPGVWSANDVLAHIRACADVWGSYIAAILSGDGVTLRRTNPRTWMKRTDYLELEFQTSLTAFTAQRVDLLTTLKALGADGWSLAATFKGGTATRQRSVLDIAGWMASHDDQHVRQIEKVVARLPRA